MGSPTADTAVYLGQFEVGSPEWAAARAHGLGGSEIAAVLGLSPWESAFSLWHRKTGTAATIPDNPILEWGRRLEDAIAEKWAAQHADVMLSQTGMWHHADRPWQIASPDRLIYDLTLGCACGARGNEPCDCTTPTDWVPEPWPHAVLEIKTARDDLGWGEPGTDEIPVYYRAQVLWYLDALGLDVCHLAVLIGGSDYREYTVTASPGEAALMRDEAENFLATIRAGLRPPIDGSDITYQLIREQHPDIEPADYPVPMEIAEPYLDALAAHKAAEEEKRRTTAVLADAMHTCRRAIYLGQTIATRVPGRDGKPPYLRATPVKEPGRKVDAA